MAGKGNSKLHEKHQLILANMLREEENKFCADCRAKGPRWASWNIGVFMCIRCAGIHRNLGVHISRVKSVNLDSWTPEQIETIQRGGNARARDVYEATLPATFRRPQDDYAVEQFIRSKYERKLYVSKDPPVSKATEAKADPGSVKVKETRKPSTNQKKEQLLAVPRPAAQAKQRSMSPPALHSTRSPVTPSTSVPNLTTAMATIERKEPTVDLLTGMAEPQQPSPQQPSPQQPSLGEDPQKSVKDTILSLYQSQPPRGYQAYTAHGYPVNPYHYQQQQVAAIRMAQQQQQQQLALNQVREVDEQMKHLKMRHAEQLGNGQPFLQPSLPTTADNLATAFPQAGGQTLNPRLW